MNSIPGNVFKNTALQFTSDEELVRKCWQEIHERYSEPHRYYHTLDHIRYFLERLQQFESRLKDRESSLFAVFYHDIVYEPKNSNNEELSAILAEERMLALGVPQESIEYCKNLILETKGHSQSSDFDMNAFLDCDLSILAAERNSYSEYSSQIRREYIVYPDDIYRPGRKKVLEHFLGMDFIFKTEEYRTLKEARARANLIWELETLGPI